MHFYKFSVLRWLLSNPKKNLPAFPNHKQNGANYMFPSQSRDVMFSQFLPDDVAYLQLAYLVHETNRKLLSITQH